MQMFDPSKYVPDLAGLAGQGNELMVRSAMANTQNMSRDFANMNELAAQKRRDRMQTRAALAQLQERQAARQSLEQRFGQRLGMQQQKMTQDQANVLYERDQKQRATDADLVAGMVGPLGAGNLNVLEQARAAALARDPSLSVQLPGEKSAAVPDTADSMTFTPDEVYPEDVNKLRVSRGDTRLYTSPDASQMRGREAAVADLLGPNAGPWSARAVEAAGAGVTGEKAAEIARAEQNRIEGRETAERVAGARMGHQRELAGQRLEREEPYKLHDRVEKMAAAYMPEVRKIDESDRMFGLAERQLGQDANAFMQNKAMAGILKAYTGAAATDAERRQDAQAAGKWNYYDKLIGTWVDGGELPPDFRQQVVAMIRDARHEGARQRHELGIRARDHVYASTSLPIGSARELADYGNQAYAAVVGRGLSADQLDAEAKRIEGDFAKRRGGRGGRGAVGALPSDGLSPDGFVPPNDMGDMGGFQGGSGARENLGTTNGGAAPSRRPYSAEAIDRTPPLPIRPPAADELDSELDREALQLLEAY